MRLDRWSLPGPRRFLDEIRGHVLDRRCVILLLPCLVERAELRRAARDLFRDDVRSWTHVDELGLPIDASIASTLHARFAPLPRGKIPSGRSLATTASFRGRVIWFDELSPERTVEALHLIEEYAAALRAVDASDSCSLVLSLSAEPGRRLPGEDTSLVTMRWRGLVDRLDALLLATTVVRSCTESSFLRRCRATIAAELGAYDLALVAALAALPLEKLLAGDEVLLERARALAWDQGVQRPVRWEDGRLDDWESSSLEHASSCLLGGSKAEIARRVWSAQVAVVFPRLEEIRACLLPELRPYIKLPLITEQGPINDLRELEWGQLRFAARGANAPGHVLALLTTAWRTRNALAHLEPLSASQLRSIDGILREKR